MDINGNSNMITKMENNTEIWKDIQGTNGLYQISNFGNVKSMRTNRLIKPGIAGGQGTKHTGYRQATLSINGKTHQEYVHRLVALHFVPYDETNLHKLRVNHKDLNKLNNHADNLEWITQKENIHHYYNSEDTIKPRYMRAVVALNTNGDIVGEFNSITEASKEMKIGASTVHKHCNNKLSGKRKIKIPYIFVFKDELSNTN